MLTSFASPLANGRMSSPMANSFALDSYVTLVAQRASWVIHIAADTDRAE